MKDNLQHKSPAQQCRAYIHKIRHKDFSRMFKSHHDEDTVELLDALKTAGDRIRVLGGNTDQIKAILKKHGVV